MIDPYTEALMKEKEPIDLRRAPADINEILLLDILAFIEERGLRGGELLTSVPSERYLELMSNLFNDYITKRGVDLEKIDIEKAEFAKGPEFNLNLDLIKNNRTREILQKSPKLQNLYKIMVGSLRKKRNSNRIGAVMTASVVEDFNKLVDKIEIMTNKETDSKFKTFSDYLTNKVTESANHKNLEESLIEEKVLNINEFINLGKVNVGNSAISIKEGSERDYMYLAQSNKKVDKDTLYDVINDDLFNGKPPYKNRLKFKKFSKGDMNKVMKHLKSNQSAANTLASLGADVTGIGRGEIMLAYIIENCGIGGGSQDIDLTLYNDKGGVLDQAELKEVQMSKDGWLYGWRTGAKHRPIIQQTLADLKSLYLGLKDVIPELDVSTKQGSEIAALVGRQEYAKFVKLVRDIDPVKVQTPLTFEIEEAPTSELVISKIGGETLGDLTDTKTLNKIKNLLSAQNTQELKSFEQIEIELAAGFGKVNEKFVFVITNSKKQFIGINYKDTLSGNTSQTQFSAASGGTVKVKVKV